MDRPREIADGSRPLAHLYLFLSKLESPCTAAAQGRQTLERRCSPREQTRRSFTSYPAKDSHGQQSCPCDIATTRHRSARNPERPPRTFDRRPGRRGGSKTTLGGWRGVEAATRCRPVSPVSVPGRRVSASCSLTPPGALDTALKASSNTGTTVRRSSILLGAPCACDGCALPSGWKCRARALAALGERCALAGGRAVAFW
jgi:hypothetical protein